MIELPTTADLAHYEQTVVLGEETFGLRFDYNDRDDSWYVDVLNADGEVLVAGVRLRSDWPPLRQYVGDELPTGAMFVLDLNGDAGEPAKADLGTRVLLVHATDAEIEAL